jgi:hypothetical protein
VVPAGDEAPAIRPAYRPPVPVSEVYACRESVEFQVDPEEAVVSIDGNRLGLADDWDGAGGGEEWRPDPGTYVACFSASELRTACVEIVIDRGARRKTCEVETELEEVD